jgi:hypothetical protein
MKYPTELIPETTEAFLLSSGKSVGVPKSKPLLRLWTGLAPEDTYGGKAVLDYKGRPAFAELAILWTFLDSGWDGVWVDTYGRRYLSEYWPSPVLGKIPARQQAVLTELAGHGKPWDVFCWGVEGQIFVEAKRSKRDSIRETQTAFLEAGLGIGLPMSSFLVVEWSVSRT